MGEGSFSFLRRGYNSVIVVKFGGTSLAGAERMRAAARIVATHRRSQPVVCVVSAMAGVTDGLIRTAQLAVERNPVWRETLTEIITQHQQTLAMLTAPSDIALRLSAAWEALTADLQQLVRTAAAPDEAYAHAVAAFSGWGERLAILLFTAALLAEGVTALPLDGEPVIMVERSGTIPATGAAAPQPRSGASVRPAPLSRRAASGGQTPRETQQALAPSVAATRSTLMPRLTTLLCSGATPVLPGYLARTREGLVTTLGRNGSDYSAAIIAAALGAEALYIYSDVAGIHRADPRAVPEAALLPALTYADAAAIAALGARVLHPGTLRPLAAANIPLRLRSALTPGSPGTNIGPARMVRQDPGSWVIVARPFRQNGAGAEANGKPAFVEVTGLFLRHDDLPAQEDDHLGPDNAFTTALANGIPVANAPATRTGALSCSPYWAGRISAIVPVAEAAATQRRLYNECIRVEFKNQHANREVNLATT
jgi:aspartokinase